MKNKVSTITIICLIAVILLLLTILIYNLNKPTAIGNMNVQNLNAPLNDTNIISNNILKTSSEKIIISPNALITFVKHYNSCGHTINERDTISENMVNMDEDEFKKLYSDWKITKFTNNEIELYKEFDGNCNEHYLVKSDQGFVSIYKINSDDSQNLLEKTDIAVKYLSPDDISELEAGVTLYGKEDLNAFIENFE